jgi:hypothetical protein
LAAPTISRRFVVRHCNGPEEVGGAGLGELDGVIVTVTDLAGAVVTPGEPQAAESKAVEVRQHTASILRPVIADILMVNIPFIRYASLCTTPDGWLRFRASSACGSAAGVLRQRVASRDARIRRLRRAALSLTGHVPS